MRNLYKRNKKSPENIIGPYYKDVARAQRSLSIEEEKTIVKELSLKRKEILSTILNLPGAIEVVKKLILKTKSVESISHCTNKTKKGHNKELKKRFDAFIQENNCTYHNFSEFKLKISWVLSAVLPKLSPPLCTTHKIKTLEKDISRLEMRLVESCLMLAVKLALEYKGKLPNEEAIQIANMSLILCVKKFNPDLGIRFNTYACQRIKYGLKDQLSINPDAIIHVPKSAMSEEESGLWFSLDSQPEIENGTLISDLLASLNPGPPEEADKFLITKCIKETFLEFLTKEEMEVVFLRYLRNLTYDGVKANLSWPTTLHRIKDLDASAIKKLQDSPKLLKLFNEIV